MFSSKHLFAFRPPFFSRPPLPISTDRKPERELLHMEHSEAKKPAIMELPCEPETGDWAACLKSYYRNSKFTDFTIITTEKELKVHKMDPCSQSGYFARMFNGNWLEANTNKVNLEGDDPDFVQTMINFMYGIEYDTTEHGATSPILFHIAAYQIAGKYDIPKLKEHAKDKFKSYITANWKMDDFPLAIAEVYRATPMCDRGLRNPLVTLTHTHLNESLKEGFPKVFEETSGFAADVATSLLKAYDALSKRYNWGDASENDFV